MALSTEPLRSSSEAILSSVLQTGKIIHVLVLIRETKNMLASPACLEQVINLCQISKSELPLILGIVPRAPYVRSSSRENQVDIGSPVLVTVHLELRAPPHGSHGSQVVVSCSCLETAPSLYPLSLSLTSREDPQCEFPIIDPGSVLISDTTSSLVKTPCGHFHMGHRQTGRNSILFT